MSSHSCPSVPDPQELPPRIDRPGAIYNVSETIRQKEDSAYVSQAEFEKEDYAQGATTELAGRGLYGDYALFIPKSVLSLDGSPGLRLERITDILLRLDYVSVARN